MKILHLVHNYYPSLGGSQLVVQKLSEGFTARFGDEVIVFTTNAIKSPSFLHNELVPSGDEVIGGVLVRRFSFWGRAIPVLKRVMSYANRARLPLRAYFDPITLGPISPAMLRATLQADADVIACMSFPFLQMYYPLARRKHPPVVLFGALHIRDAPIAAPILRAIARADAYVAFTEFEKQALIRHGIAAARIHVIGLGVDVDKFARGDGRAIRARHGIGDAPVVGFIGRQAIHKGCDTLVRAMATVWERRPDAYLVLAGARTAFSPQIDKLVAELPTSQRERVIVVTDFAEAEKPDWFAACDVFVSVSSDESFGLVFVEAWAAGRPVIGGRIGAVECVIRHGEDGLLVPVGEPSALADSIRQLLEDPVRAAEFGRRGRAKVVAEYDWPRVIDKVHALYDRLI